MSPTGDLVPAPPRPGDPLLLVGASAACARLDALIARVAGTPRTTVLVRGERGAGRRLAARLIHARSRRCGGPLVELHAARCAPGDLAVALAAAAGGTLVLGEVQALSAASQEALLAALDEPGPDVRLVAVTSADLEREVRRGVLREDLFYRLNVLALEVPPLRERRDDVLPLARALLAELAAGAGVAAPGLGADAAAALREHGWPGNLRELRGVLEAAAARVDGASAIARADLALPGSPRAPGADPFDGERRLDAIEERLIRLVLAETGGNKSRAARRLGVNRQTLYNKLAALASRA